jgi:hypothetical protein
MDWIIETVYSSTHWLYKVIYSNKFFFIDYWTFNHIWSGAFVYIILRAKRIQKVWLVLILILLSYEIVEILFRIFALNLFKPEIIKDQINDIIFGLLGGVLCHYLLKIRKGKSWNKFHLRYPLTSFLTAGTISYLYVGFSDVGNESVQEYSGLIKISMFAFIWIAIYYLLQIYELLKIKRYGELKASAITSVVFLPLFFFIQIFYITLLQSGSANSFAFFQEIIYNKGKIIAIAIFFLLPAISIIVYKAFKRLIKPENMKIRNVE